MEKHTPTPWHVECGRYSTGRRYRAGLANLEIRSASGHLVVPTFGDSDTRAQPDAAFIVAAVNTYESHRATIAALSEALDCLVSDLNCIMPADLVKHFGASKNKARAVLARARGESGE